MSKSKVRFVGRPGSYISGIPARDLSSDEWNKLTPKQQEFAISSELYKKSAGKSSPDKDQPALEKRKVNDE